MVYFLQLNVGKNIVHTRFWRYKVTKTPWAKKQKTQTVGNYPPPTPHPPQKKKKKKKGSQIEREREREGERADRHYIYI